jgi:hypothetical protein
MKVLMSQETGRSSFDWRRLVVGILAVVFFCLAAAIYLFDIHSASGMQGILIRLGLVLAAIWLAMPQLGKLTMFQSVGAVAIVGVMILIAASRPNVFRIAGILLVVGLAINWALRWLTLAQKNRS